MKIFYFTSTGNSLSIAKQFEDAELISIPKALKNNELSYSDEDKIGVIFPTYAMSMPKIVKDFLSKATLSSPYVFVIANCGGSAGGSIDNFISIANKSNIHVNYNAVITMPGNYLPLADMASNGTTDHDAIKKVVADISNKVENSIKNKSFYTGLTSTINTIFTNVSKGTAKKFTVENTCTLCKTCEKVCPVKNINVDTNVSFSNNCLSCFACTHNCPTNSIRYKKEKSKVRYRNKNVSLQEMINSNNQL